MERAALESEADRLWRDVSGFLQVDEHRANRNKLHIQHPQAVAAPVCDLFNPPTSFRYKSPDVFPPDTDRVCGRCLDVWKDE